MNTSSAASHTFIQSVDVSRLEILLPKTNSPVLASPLRSLHLPIDRLRTSALTAINTFAYLRYVYWYTPASIGLGVFLPMSPLSQAANAGSIAPAAIGTVDAQGRADKALSFYLSSMEGRIVWRGS